MLNFNTDWCCMFAEKQIYVYYPFFGEIKNNGNIYTYWSETGTETRFNALRNVSFMTVQLLNIIKLFSYLK